MAIDVNNGEYVTHIRFEFGMVPAGFKPTKASIFFVYILPHTMPSYKVIFRSECGGKYREIWATASALWTTAVAFNGATGKTSRTNALFKTSY